MLLRGDKGSAKSTLARALAALLPGEAPFVELPLGATQDRVVGSLDLAAAMAGGEVRLQPGLLAAADGGVLYVDEVNLLPDHLVDVVLDAAASGEHRVERDGFSLTHRARFVLIGSMNPEEGELRPQLLDRFGLSVAVRSPTDPQLRAAVVRDRLAFDRHGRAALGQAVAEDERLAGRLGSARPAEVGEETAAFAARVALAVGAEGLRADLVLCRAAAALAGWEGRGSAAVADVERVAPLVLGHRRRRRPFDPPEVEPDQLRAALDEARNPRPPGAGDGRDSGATGPTAAGGGEAGPEGAGRGRGGASPGTGSAGDDQPSPAPPATWGQRAGSAMDSVGRPLGLTAGPSRPGPSDLEGVAVGDVPMGDPGGRLAVVPSLRHGLARSARALEGPERSDASSGVGADGSVRLAPSDLRRAVHHRPERRCVILTVDSSGSMAGAARLEAATAAVLGLLSDAYRRRHRVALVGFGGHGAEVALPPTASVEIARARLGDLPSGGSTPLAEGLEEARLLARRVRSGGDRPVVVVLTDGRATAGPGALERAMAAARGLAEERLDALVLDAEDGPSRLGLAPRLAAAMGAACVRLDRLEGGAIEAAIRASEADT